MDDTGTLTFLRFKFYPPPFLRAECSGKFVIANKEHYRTMMLQDDLWTGPTLFYTKILKFPPLKVAGRREA